MLKALTGTRQHFFGGWQKLCAHLHDPRHPDLRTPPLAALLGPGVLMDVFRVGARRQSQHTLRGNGPSQAKAEAWFGRAESPHGETLNYPFKKLAVAEVQEGVCRMVATLVRQKVLPRGRLFGHSLVARDGTGMLTLR